MKRVFTLLLFALALTAWPVLAQEIDESFLFLDENGEYLIPLFRKVF